MDLHAADMEKGLQESLKRGEDNDYLVLFVYMYFAYKGFRIILV